MKRLIAFSVRPDELGFIQNWAKTHPEIEIDTHRRALTADNAEMVKGYDGVSILGAPAGRDVLTALKENGIQYVASRSIGYDNIDIEAVQELGLHVSNVEYSPGSVAEYTLMLILMSLRKAKTIMRRADIQDFSLIGSHGRELRNLTVGIIGTGRIGLRLAQYLTGFGCRVIGYDPYPNEDAHDLVEYVTFNELLGQADVITLHTPSTDDNYHLLDADAFARMKDEVVIVNCSRGELIHSDALIGALEEGKVSAAALDVVEGDEPIFHRDWRNQPVVNKQLQILRSFPNVTVTPHIAFYTLDVVNEMVTCALESMTQFWETGTSDREITK
ncbi:MAG: D-isomer specific 2-hydroxyacid dehydrogenase family protein [Actinomycetaceae bacterium]|nr:D-isomer specific 2-hydroxyacid dehydrogenase family protein [Actinomycetaceae bacterium]